MQSVFVEQPLGRLQDGVLFLTQDGLIFISWVSKFLIKFERSARVRCSRKYGIFLGLQIACLESISLWFVAFGALQNFLKPHLSRKKLS